MNKIISEWNFTKNLSEEEMLKIIESVDYKKQTIICMYQDSFIYEADRVSNLRDSEYYAIINLPSNKNKEIDKNEKREIKVIYLKRRLLNELPPPLRIIYSSKNEFPPPKKLEGIVYAKINPKYKLSFNYIEELCKEQLSDFIKLINYK